MLYCPRENMAMAAASRLSVQNSLNSHGQQREQRTDGKQGQRAPHGSGNTGPITVCPAVQNKNIARQNGIEQKQGNRETGKQRILNMVDGHKERYCSV